MKSPLEKILKAFPRMELLKADGLDDAIIGVVLATTSPRLVYSVEKCIQVMMRDQGWSYEEAFEFLDYNTFHTWMGEKTPIWYYDLEEDMDYENT